MNSGSTLGMKEIIKPTTKNKSKHSKTHTFLLSVFFPKSDKDGSMTLVNKSAPIETLSSVSNTPV